MNNYHSPLDTIIKYTELLPKTTRIFIAVSLALMHFLIIFYDSRFGQGQFLSPETTIQEFFVIRIIRSPFLFLYSYSFFDTSSIISLLLYIFVLVIWLLFWIIPHKITFYLMVIIIFLYLLFLEICTQIGCCGTGC